MNLSAAETAGYPEISPPPSRGREVYGNPTAETVGY